MGAARYTRQTGVGKYSDREMNQRIQRQERAAVWAEKCNFIRSLAPSGDPIRAMSIPRNASLATG